MKARKRVIGIFLIAVFMCLSIGFAAITTDLFIDGTLKLEMADVADTYDAMIYFDNEQLAEGTSVKDEAKSNIGLNLDDTDDLKITVPEKTFSAVGQKVVVTVDIINESPNAANIAITAITGGVAEADNSGLTVGSFKVTCELPATKIDANDGTNNGKLANVKITIELVKLPTADETNKKFQFTLTATAA